MRNTKTGFLYAIACTLMTLFFFNNKVTAQGTITVYPDSIRHTPSSYVIGIQRNHIFAQVKDENDPTNEIYSTWFEEMLSNYRAIRPGFGNEKKLYRLGGNQIDGQIAGLSEDMFQNPDAHPIFQQVINTCKQSIESVSEIGLLGTNEFRFYNDPSKANGPNDKLIYVENGNYLGYDWEKSQGSITDQSGKTGQYDDIKYYVREAQKMDADLTVTINFSSGTPEEAIGLMDEIKSLDGGTLNRVKFIELGNEVSEPYIKGNRTHFGIDENGNCKEYPSKSKNRLEYAENALEYSIKLRNWLDINGGNDIKIGAVATTGSNWFWNKPDNINRTLEEMLLGTNPAFPGQKLKDYIDFVIFHSYPSYPVVHTGGEQTGNDIGRKYDNEPMGPRYTDEELATLVMSQCAWNQHFHLEEKTNILNNINPNLRIANSEYYSHFHYLWFDSTRFRPKLIHSITEGLYTADNIITALKYDFDMAVNFAFYHYQFEQNEVSDNLLFSVDKNNQIVKKKTVFEVQKLIAEEFGTVIIKSTENFDQFPKISITDLAQFPGKRDNINKQTIFSYAPIDYVASKKDNGDVVILLINRTPNDQLNIKIEGTLMDNPIVTMNSIEGDSFTDQRRLEPGGFKPMSLDNINIPKLSINIIKVSNNQCIDEDGDGICIPEDCNDNDVKLPVSEDIACNDNNPNTINDMIKKGECECKGEIIPDGCSIRPPSAIFSDEGNCRSYELSIQPIQNLNTTSIQINNLPTNGLTSLELPDNSFLNLNSTSSFEWVLNNINSNQTYIAYLKYCNGPFPAQVAATPKDCTSVIFQPDGSPNCVISNPSFKLESIQNEPNCVNYKLRITATAAAQNISLVLTNMPSNGYVNGEVPENTALNFRTQNSYNWEISQINANETKELNVKFCWAQETPIAIAMSPECPGLEIFSEQQLAENPGSPNPGSPNPGGTNPGSTNPVPECIISASKFELNDLGNNCKEYVAELQFSEDVQNLSLLFENLPTNGTLDLLLPDASVVNKTSINSFEWNARKLKKNQTYIAKMKFCGSDQYPNAYISMKNCDQIPVIVNHVSF